jgi:hypothetical protein
VANNQPGKVMSSQTIARSKYPISGQAQRMQDALLVSSFGLWAIVLGLAPALLFRLATGS